MRLLKFAALLALLPSLAFAQTMTQAPNSTGRVGPIIPAVDTNGAAIRTVLPGFTLVDPATGLPTTPGVSASNVLSASFTRPADTTAYASGDLVANSTTAGSVAPLSFASAAPVTAGSASVIRARLATSSTSTTNASFRIHLYTASPTATNGDNGAWLTTESGNFCALDITLDKVFAASAKGIGTPVAGSTCTFKLTSGTTIYGLVEARGAYTPTSAGTFTVELEVMQ